MTEADIEGVIERLHEQLSHTPSEVGVAMGHELYSECGRRGLLEMKTFSVLGTTFLPNDLPTVNGVHFAFVHFDFPDWEFRVGPPRQP